MFDPITTALMQTAPTLEGLDLATLPRRLTQAFADIVSARIRLRDSAAGAINPAVTDNLAELRRLAATYESYVVLLPERDNRAAAAFVAASAHQAFLLGDGQSDLSSRIDISSISPEICATLLFLVAEANADAAEAAKRISYDGGQNPIERSLLLSLKNFAHGRLFEIASQEVPEVGDITSDPNERALQALQLMLLRGVISLAKQLRRRVDIAPSEGGVDAAAEIFRSVKALCIESVDGILSSEGQVFSLFPGPLHLANLLLSVERDLLETTLTRVPTPSGLPENGWWQIIRRMARRRPYLWRNHRKAIASGYLEQGKSAAISFPTGGGKSILAELKIATSLLMGRKVVFLAPTHALVSQTTYALKATFRGYDIYGDADEEITFTDQVVLPEVIVTTPERCLMLLSLQPAAFADLGLIVFDECHLLHPRADDRSRRSLDAMLVVLNLTREAPSADLLLMSAMMKNTGEIAGWLASLTGNECLTLDLAWKPTRQVRGCIVYPAEQISALNTKLSQARSDTPGQQSAPAAVKRELVAQPFGLFSLLQTWSTMDREDYALVPLLSDEQPLSTGKTRGGNWYLTPNGNKSSGAIAAAAVAAGMKTLVFVQTTVFCESCVADFARRLKPRAVALTAEEAKWRELAVSEMGGAQYCYLQLDDDGVLRAGAASHHGLLLREERELHESLYKRPDGIDVLFATSTLAQGMNLPSAVVIISGDSRFDPEVDKMQKLEAHELLNAAGRAGRAGEGSQGFVLLVPSKVIDFDNKEARISGHWKELQAIFEQADQCLVIEDPFEQLLDQIHDGLTTGGMPAYFLSKLPLADESQTEDPAGVLLKRSLAAYRAREKGDLNWIDSRVAAAIVARTSVELSDEQKWIEQVAGSTGLSIKILQQLIKLVDANAFDGSATEVMDALLDWLANDPIVLMDIIRPESLEGLFGDQYKKLPSDIDRSAQALSVIKMLLPLWMSGRPLCDLEAKYQKPGGRLGRCVHARHFVSRIVPELSFLASLPARLIVARDKKSANPSVLRTVLATLGSSVREGCDSPESLAVRVNLGRNVSRVAAREIFEKIGDVAVLGSSTEDFEQTRNRMRGAHAISMLSVVEG